MIRLPPRPSLFPYTALFRSGFIIYPGQLFPEWQGNGFISGLSSQSLVRIEFDGENAREAERFEMGDRIRTVKQGPDGAIWLLEDDKGGRLLKLKIGRASCRERV